MVVQSREDRLLAKIEKLMRLASRNSNENEAASSAAKVQELLIQWNLTAEQVSDAAQRRADQAREPLEHDWYRGHRSASGEGSNEIEWKLLLAFGVARGNLCRVIHYGGRKELLWIGRKSNIEVSQYLYETLVADLERIAENHWNTILEVRKYEKATGKKIFPADRAHWRDMHGRVWKTAFFLGAVETIRERLTRGLSEMRAAPGTNALVISEDGQLDLYYEEHFGKGRRLGNYRQRGTGADNAAYQTGRSTGSSIAFKTGLGTGGADAPRRIGAGAR